MGGCPGACAFAFACARVALLIQHATRMHLVVFLDPPDFLTLSHKRHDFQKETLLDTKYVFWFSLQFVSKVLLILRRIQRDIVIKLKTLHVKCPLFLSDFNKTLIFRKKLKYQISSKSVQLESYCSKRTYGRMDRHDEANSRFLQFCEKSLKTYRPVAKNAIYFRKRQKLAACDWTTAYPAFWSPLSHFSFMK